MSQNDTMPVPIFGNDPGDFQAQIDDLTRQFDEQIRSHSHDGVSATLINLSEILGRIEVVSTAPTAVPRDFYDQFKLYENGGTYRLYVYGTAWHYVALT